MTKLILFASILCAFASCGKIELPTSQHATPADTIATPSQPDMPTTTDTLTVEQAIAIKATDSLIWVKGYIVGYVQGTSLFGTHFGLPPDSNRANTNLLLADRANEIATELCMPIALESKSEYRSMLNLFTHPDLMHRQVCIEGITKHYFGVIGFKSILTLIWPTPPPTTDAPTPTIDTTTTSIAEGLAKRRR